MNRGREIALDPILDHQRFLPERSSIERKRTLIRHSELKEQNLQNGTTREVSSEGERKVTERKIIIRTDFWGCLIGECGRQGRMGEEGKNGETSEVMKGKNDEDRCWGGHLLRE